LISSQGRVLMADVGSVARANQARDVRFIERFADARCRRWCADSRARPAATSVRFDVATSPASEIEKKGLRAKRAPEVFSPRPRRRERGWG